MRTRTGTRLPAGAGPCAGMAFDGERGSIAAARAFAADFLARAADEHGVAVPRALVADAQLVVSELVTNAVKCAPGPCSVELRIQGRLLEIGVWDGASALPEPRPPEPGRIGQHGLEIVMALSEGFEVRQDPVGKRVTALLALAPLAEAGQDRPGPRPRDLRAPSESGQVGADA
jgi:anti-sigma regulatory factor (Ser/Thr protein kinase)